VDVAAVAMGLPFSRLSALTGFRREDQPDADSATMPSASMRIVSPDYFKALRIPLRAGRLFDQRDRAAGVEVALINERTAERFFAGLNPIGQRIRVSAQLVRGVPNGPKTIVGVVGDVKDRGIDAETPADIYLPYDQHQVDAFTVAVRTSANPLSVVAALRRDVTELDPLLPIANLEQMPALVDASMAGRRFTMSLVLAFAGVAVVLSVVGVYGVLAYLVAQRTREIGVRLAVGASTANVLWLIVREGVALSVMGLAGGLIGALAAGRWIATMLYQVTPGDATTFAGVTCVVALAAVAATCVPARRASRVDPVIVLRSE
jgi:putative ABC transport system permease protein